MIISPPRQQGFRIAKIVDSTRTYVSTPLISLKKCEKGDQYQQQQKIYAFRSNDSTQQATLTDKR